MFEAATSPRKISKDEYETEVARLRWELLDAQRALAQATFPVVVLFGGVDGAGKSETVHLLNEWMDPRWLINQAFDAPSPDERERPPFWRFWLALPPRGRMGLFMSAWYSAPLMARVNHESTRAEFDAALARIVAFERMLAADGALVLKFWMHLDKAAQRRRLETLHARPETRWRVSRTQWRHYELYSRFIGATERIIQQTSTAEAPWIVVDGSDERYRSLAVGTHLRDALRARLEPPAAPRRDQKSRGKRPIPHSASLVAKVDRARSVFESLDMERTLPKAAYKRDLEKEQGRLNRLQRRAQARGRSLILVFEGWDAAGKGGAIRRVTAALEPRVYRVHAVAAPTDEERARHYLWRFWRHVSRAGRVVIFDRSWYGRVLVERVERFATEAEWQRAYGEINDFEAQLHEHGTILVKYWLHITKQEQARRFEERAKSPYKSWKLSTEDWRNRARWADYEAAVNDMVARTSTHHAPWHLVAANDKNAARMEVIRHAADALEKALR